MEHYFIDFENLHLEAFKGIQALKNPCTIYVLGSNKTDSNCFKFSLLADNDLFNKTWKFIKAENGAQDALDIELGTLLGMTVNERKGDKFRIISADSGYDSTIKALQRSKIDIKRTHSFLDDIDPLCNDADLCTCLKDCPDIVIVQINKIVKENDSLSDIHNNIVKLYKNTNEGKVIYQKLKPYLKQIGKK